MATIGTMVLNFTADIAGLTSGIAEAQSQLQKAGKSMRTMGAAATAGVTVPMAAMGGAALMAANDFNSSMANVQTLLTDMADGGTARTLELSEAVQSMAVSTGKSTGDLAGGLYQVISAFGDTSDTVAILEMNAKAAAAGLATTEDAIALTSAVSKNFGDTSAEAIGQISDMAFATVKMGKTSFPELASAMGSIAPIAASVGLSQEELFGTMATATGVTGGAAEVATQLRGVLQALMAPSAQMSELLASMGYASGEAMLQAEGLQGTIATIVAASQASGSPLQNFIGSVEGMSLASALAGDLSTDLTKKIGDMSQAAGATDAAFAAQTSGVNELGFTLEQTQQQMAVVAQDLGAALAPALSAVMEAATPLIEGIASMAEAFSNMNPKMQTAIVAGGGLLMAVGPLGMAVGGVVSAVTALTPLLGPLATVVGALFSPVGLVLVAVAGLAAIMFDWGGANEKVATTLENWGLEGIADGVRKLHEWTEKVVTVVGDLLSGERSFGDVFNAIAPEWMTTRPAWLDTLAGLGFPEIPQPPAWLTNLIDFAWPGVGNAPGWVQTLVRWAWPVLLPVTWVKSLVEWAWPVLAEIPWISNLLDWDWPTLSKPSWIQKLLDFRWPGFPTRPGWLGGGGDDVGNNAAGTPRWRGGLTWVGEEGPELVNLPRGTQIFPAGVSAAMAGGAGGQNITVNVYADVANDVDVNNLARRVVREIKMLNI